MIEFIPKDNQSKHMRISVQCPYCGEGLQDESHTINEEPTFALLCEVPSGDEIVKDVVYFSAFHGDNLNETNLDIKDGLITRFFCPFCESDLGSSHDCDLCGAPLIRLQLRQGGMLQYCLEAYARNTSDKLDPMNFVGMVHFCSRKGCQKHLIEFANPNADIKEFYEAYAPFLETRTK